jgi:hypothetical protein
MHKNSGGIELGLAESFNQVVHAPTIEFLVVGRDPLISLMFAQTARTEYFLVVNLQFS